MKAALTLFALLFTFFIHSQDYWDINRVPIPSATLPDYTQLAIESSSRIWLATDDNQTGLVLWDNGTITQLTSNNSGLPSNVIQSMAFHDGKLWLVTANGLVSYNGSSFTSNPEPGQQLLVGGINDDLWLVDGTEVKRYSGTSFTTFFTHTTDIRDIAIDGNDNIWFTDNFVILDANPLYRYTQNGLETFFINDIDPTLQNIDFVGYSLAAGNDYAVLGTVAHGYYWHDGTAWSHVDEDDGFWGQNATSVHIDETGAIWSSSYVDDAGPSSNVIHRQESQIDAFNFSNHVVLFNQLASSSEIIAACGNEGALYIAPLEIEALKSSAILDINNIVAQFDADGTHFAVDQTGARANFEFNPGDSTYVLNSWAPMIGVKTASNDLYASAGIYTSDFWAGPVSDKMAVYRDPIIKFNQSDIDDHIANYQSAGYTVPDNIKAYPGSGLFALGESIEMAPFVDANANGFYDPENGDYPVIRGDQAIFQTINDRKLISNLTGGESGDIEIQALMYGYDSPQDPALNNSIFFHYTIINRSNQDYDSVKFGTFTDFDLGNPGDDYVGSNPAKNTYYAYNGDNFDQNWQDENGFLDNPPVVGVRYLEKPLDNFLNWSNSGGPVGFPGTDQSIWNYLNSRLLDGTPMTTGGNGYNPGSTNYTNHLFDGDPFTSAGWTEVTAGNAPADRRGMGSFPSTSLAAGERISFDLVLTVARGDGNNHLENIQELFDVQDDAEQFYDNQTFEEGDLATAYTPAVGIETNALTKERVSVFPNPSNGFIRITSAEPLTELTVLDAQGRSIQLQPAVSRNGYAVALPGSLENGVYFLQVKSASGEYHSKKIVLMR